MPTRARRTCKALVLLLVSALTVLAVYAIDDCVKTPTCTWINRHQ